LGHVPSPVVTHGRAAIDDLYPLQFSASTGEPLIAAADQRVARRMSVDGATIWTAEGV
jgi:hypothetical protein